MEETQKPETLWESGDQKPVFIPGTVFKGIKLFFFLVSFFFFVKMAPHEKNNSCF